MIRVYSTGCPKCNVIETKLRNKKIEFEKIEDLDIISKLGFVSLPVIEVDNKYIDFSDAIKYINQL